MALAGLARFGRLGTAAAGAGLVAGLGTAAIGLGAKETKSEGKPLTEKKSESPPVTFYSSWFCPFAQRVWIALEEKQVAYDYVEINPYEAGVGGRSTKKALPLDEKRRRYPEFVAASPRGLVPAMQHGSDVRVCDSMVCVEYVDEAFVGGEALLPDSAAERARVRQWSAFAGANIIPHYYKMLMAQDASAQAQAKASALAGLSQWVDAMDADGPYFLGSRFSMADLALLPWVERLLTVGKTYRGFELDEADARSARLRAWRAACLQRPSVRRTLADEARLVENYSEYADNSATSDAARRFK